MRRIVSRLLLLCLLSAAVVAVPAAAHARPARVAAPAACPHAKPYPPTPDATVQASTTHPAVGQKIEASGIHYCPDEDVTLTIAGKFVGTAHTDSAGSFDPQVVVPGPPGQKPLCGIGASGLPNDRDCLTLFVQAAGTSGNSSGGGTSFTGVEIGALTAVAALLIVAGVALVRAGRRNKQSLAG
jgi:hypothetical protein